MPLLFNQQLLLSVFALMLCSVTSFTTTPFGLARPTPAASRREQTAATTTLTMTGTGEEVTPSTFREAEVLGLKFMQEQQYDKALRGMYFRRGSLRRVS
jgi:hypothetical protein